MSTSQQPAAPEPVPPGQKRDVWTKERLLKLRELGDQDKAYDQILQEIIGNSEDRTGLTQEAVDKELTNLRYG